MAVTKIWRVRGKVGNVIDYANNPEKTIGSLSPEELDDIAGILEYADDERKTEDHFFTTGINCNKEFAKEEFAFVKNQYGKQGGIVAIHGYQSFEEEHISPALAHEIGVKLATELWGDRFQVIVATHLNSGHVHNHFVVNTVSFQDGKRFHMCTDRYLELRAASDRLCQEYGLSVIENPKCKALHPYLYKMERSGAPTRYNIARAALDEAISRSLTIEELKYELKGMGYKVQFSPNRKYWTVTLPGWKKAIRLQKLGPDYTNDRIMERIYDNDQSIRQEKFQRTYNISASRLNLPTRMTKIKKRGRLERMYLIALFEMGYLPKYKQSPARVHRVFKDELLKCEKYSREARLLGENKIATEDDLEKFAKGLEEELATLTGKRVEPRNKYRRETSPETKQKLKEEIAGLTSELRSIRSELKLCEDIKERSGIIEEKLNTIDIERSGKEVREYEPIR